MDGSFCFGDCLLHGYGVRLQTEACQEFLQKGCDSCQLFSPAGYTGHLMPGCVGHCGALGLDISTLVPVCGGWVCREGDCRTWPLS